MGVARSLCRRLLLDCNHQLSIVMSLSTTFTQCAPQTTKFSKITQNKGHFALQGHSRSPILVPIESSYTTPYQSLILTYLLSCTVRNPSKCHKSLYLANPLAFKPSTEGFPWTIFVRFSVIVNGWLRYQMAKKHCRKFKSAE